MKEKNSLAVTALDVPPRTVVSIYPEPFASRMAGREKRALGEFFGITKFGVNLTRLAPGAQSALLHCHSKQQEFIYILVGNPTLITDSEEIILQPGMCSGFVDGGLAHYLVNRTIEEVLYLEVGDREQSDQVTYPQDDLVAEFGSDGRWHFSHKNGKSY